MELVQCLLICSHAVELRVGIYNSIPDLGHDGLQSYKNLIEMGYNDASHTVDAVVDEDLYDPYGDLNQYLSPDGFDLIEMDTADLLTVFEAGLVQSVASLPDDVMPASASAVMINGTFYGYPSLACGNFIIGLTPGNEINCPLRISRVDYDAFHEGMNTCKSNLLVTERRRRILGGKMNDGYGWYLPFLYVDGYIDVHGMCSVEEAVENVLKEEVDGDVCERLSWYIGCCDDKDELVENKCYYDFNGSYVQSSSNVFTDIKQGETLFFFGFSEKLAVILQETNLEYYAAISGPLGPYNHLLQFTDALVINKARWEMADEEKKNAIRAFAHYFLSPSLRERITLGVDLSPPQTRYLLPATETFYMKTQNTIYQDIYWSLKRAVAAPSLSNDQRVSMETVLSEKCVTL